MLLILQKMKLMILTLLYVCIKRGDEYDGIIFFLCNTWNKQNHKLYMLP